MSNPKRITAYLVAAGDYHDIDHARLELLKLLAEHENIRVQVAADYHDIDAIKAADFLVTYTCNLVPTEAEQKALTQYIESGKKWFALHGTNAILKFTDKGVDSPETAPILMKTLGTQFIAHPPIHPFKVKVSDASHPLVQGVGEFETDDELYLSRIHGKLKYLLETNFVGEATGFLEKTWTSTDPHPLYYINKVGGGEVLYLNLGHCRGHFDMHQLMPYYPKVERGSWDKPQFYELLRRGIKYCAAV